MSSDSDEIRLLVVDDHHLVREGVVALVEGQQDIRIVAEAANGREAIQQFRTHHPDVTLMDLQMPEMNGLDAVIAIRDEFPEARIVVLTTYAGDVQVLRAVKAGARGYLLKNAWHKVAILHAASGIHAGGLNLDVQNAGRDIGRCKSQGGVPLVESALYCHRGFHVEFHRAFYRRNLENGDACRSLCFG